MFKKSDTVTRILFVLLFATLIQACATIAGEKKALDTSPRKIGKDVTCPVCNMFPALYPKFQAQVIFTDGSYAAFDGCRDMFRFLLEMGKYDKKHTRNDVAKIWVKGFDTGNWLDARKAHYIVGSNVMGPMGKEVIPFADHEKAMAFMEKHGGIHKHFAEIDMEVIRPLIPKMKMKMKMKGGKMGKEGMDMQMHK